VTRTLPNDAEAGGGLMVAVIQLGITVGATVGGLVLDASGARATFVSSAVILVLAGVTAFAAGRVHGRTALATPDSPNA
jgi:predicted MFS family arabinose efflux permease